MPDPTPTPGEIAYEAYWRCFEARLSQPWDETPAAHQTAWEAAAEAVLTADADGRHITTALFRYGIGDVLRLAGHPSRQTVCMRRWVERPSMPPYAEYAVESPSGLVGWEVEADLAPWEDTP